MRGMLWLALGLFARGGAGEDAEFCSWLNPMDDVVRDSICPSDNDAYCVLDRYSATDMDGVVLNDCRLDDENGFWPSTTDENELVCITPPVGATLYQEFPREAVHVIWEVARGSSRWEAFDCWLKGSPGGLLWKCGGVDYWSYRPQRCFAVCDGNVGFRVYKKYNTDLEDSNNLYWTVRPASAPSGQQLCSNWNSKYECYQSTSFCWHNSFGRYGDWSPPQPPTPSPTNSPTHSPTTSFPTMSPSATSRSPTSGLGAFLWVLIGLGLLVVLVVIACVCSSKRSNGAPERVSLRDEADTTSEVEEGRKSPVWEDGQE
eukprot:Hpha_TRINITY_DN15987_c2_g2::TRINITY_DN15987_c2_g2_i2::g.72354::m.72354